MDKTMENGYKLSEGQNRTDSFLPAATQQLLNPISLGINSLQFTTATKVLEVCIDNKLSFEDHSCKMAKKIYNRWRMITRFTNRTNGLNHIVIVKLIKTTFLPILLFRV